MKRALIIGGANGIGLAIATELANHEDYELVYIVDKSSIAEEHYNVKFRYYQFDLTQADFSFFTRFDDIDTLMITAGFGRLALFKDLDDDYIINSFKVNSIAIIRILRHFYNKLECQKDFYCGVMVSISGFMSSPFYSVYAATKAALKVFIESVNVELIKSGSSNQIMNVSPGAIKGTSFNNGRTDLTLTNNLAKDIASHLHSKDDIFIPQYDEVYKKVLQRYHDDFRAEGLHSYEYKMLTMNNR